MIAAPRNTPPWIDGAAIRAAISYPDAVHALGDALSRPGTIAAMPKRQIVDTQPARCC